ncbi:MAG: BrnT family toxin [Novosphingobium sp.]
MPRSNCARKSASRMRGSWRSPSACNRSGTRWGRCWGWVENAGFSPMSCLHSRLGSHCLLYVNHIVSDMEFEFDPAKDEVNRFKHGLRLAFGTKIFADPDHVVVPTVRLGDEEERFKAIGLVEGKLHTAIHVWRDDVVRFISVRRSNGSEQRDYDRYSGRSE